VGIELVRINYQLRVRLQQPHFLVWNWIRPQDRHPSQQTCNHNRSNFDRNRFWRLQSALSSSPSLKQVDAKQRTSAANQKLQGSVRTFQFLACLLDRLIDHRLWVQPLHQLFWELQQLVKYLTRNELTNTPKACNCWLQEARVWRRRGIDQHLELEKKGDA